MNSTRSCLLLLVGILLIGVNKAGAAWLREGTPVAAASGNQDRHVLVGDGSGGAFLSWSDQRSGVRLLYVQHVDADGEPTWAVDGIRVTTSTIQQSDSAL